MNSVICTLLGLLVIFWNLNASIGHTINMKVGRSESCKYKSIEMRIGEWREINCVTCTCKSEGRMACFDERSFDVAGLSPKCKIIPGEHECETKAVLKEDETITCPYDRLAKIA